ncbi:hypothetical protein [Halobacillus sp. A5]|uniref:hypothetical protein n=1 Tax=Halobacillus sp. A5 TaxID=2880263 RepID=UPI0020A65E1C|nr:hypothetical protein [Halobacillus sp. A5]MCP3028764.1 hypothetical protein [Halobacillus sp. A5]
MEEKYALATLPKGIVWTSENLATTVFSAIPVPAYTNGDVIYISPDLSAWRRLLVEQLEGQNISEIENFYDHCSDDYLFTILAQELTHHSNLFVEGFNGDSKVNTWFEEGMCNYLSRKHLLDNAEFKELTNVEVELVEIFKDKYGQHSLDELGSNFPQSSNLTSRMFDYWRSYLIVEFLVEIRANQDLDWVFNEYSNWDSAGRKIPLLKYFEMENFFN